MRFVWKMLFCIKIRTKKVLTFDKTRDKIAIVAANKAQQTSEKKLKKIKKVVDKQETE